MADEKPGAEASDAADVAYRNELAERVKKDVEGMGISTEEKPAEPAKEDPDAPPEEKDGDERKDTEEGEEEKPEEKGQYSKAFRKLQKQEAELQTFKTQILAADREIKQREQRVSQGERELGAFIKALQLDPFETLIKNNLMTEDQAEYASKQLYYRSKAAAGDPKNKAEADRLRREYEGRREVQDANARIQRLEDERARERAEVQQAQQREAYVAKLDATINSYKSKTPLLAKALEKNPDRTNLELRQIAIDLSNKKQALADPGLVVLAWITERKRLLADHGLSEPVATTTEQAKSKPAAEKKGPSNGTTQSSKQAQSEADAEAKFKAELKARLEGTYDGD